MSLGLDWIFVLFIPLSDKLYYSDVGIRRKTKTNGIIPLIVKRCVVSGTPLNTGE
jgi:hypothetical protein